jgi:hypothetical protein
MSPTRQLAAIMFTDIVGYIAMAKRNEGGGSHQTLKHFT